MRCSKKNSRGRSLRIAALVSALTALPISLPEALAKDRQERTQSSHKKLPRKAKRVQPHALREDGNKDISSSESFAKIVKTKPKRKAAPRRPPSEVQQTDETSGFSLIFRVLIGMTTVGLFVFRKKDQDSIGESPIPNVQALHQHAARPLDLPKSPGIDPSTVHQDQTLVGIAIPDAPSSTPVLHLDDENPQDVALEIELLTNIKGQKPFPIVEEGSTGKRTSPLALLPGELSTHFSLVPRETCLWSTELGSDGKFGALGVTNRRVLLVRRRRRTQLLPPSFEMELRKFQFPVGLVASLHADRIRKTRYLAVTLAVFWFFPFGTVAACAALALHFLATDPCLVLGAGGSSQSIPMQPDQQGQFKDAVVAARHALVQKRRKKTSAAS